MANNSFKARFKNYGATNIRVSKYSPRKSGEHEERSHWKEVYPVDFKTALSLSGRYAKVWYRTATFGGAARLFVWVEDTGTIVQSPQS